MDLKQLNHIAKLAGISFDDDELKSFAKDFDGIVNHIGILDDVKTENVPPLNTDNDKTNLREDNPIIIDDDLLSNSSQKNNQYIKYKKK